MRNCAPFWKEAEDAGIDREALYGEYKEYIQKTKNDIDFFKEINYFLKELKGFGHLTVLDGYRYRQYLTALNASDVLSEKQKENIKSLESVLYNPVSSTTYGLLDQSHTGFRSIKGLKSDYNETVQDEENSQMLPLEADIQPGNGTNSDGEGNEACGTSPDILISEKEDAFEKCKSMINNTK